MLGTLKKMRSNVDANNQIHYSLPVGDELLPMNDLIGKRVTLTHTGNIHCQNCGKKTKKSFSLVAFTRFTLKGSLASHSILADLDVFVR